MTKTSSATDQTLQVDFEPIGRRIDIQPGTNLLHAAQSAGVQIVALCGGTGCCGSCRVKIMAGQVTPITAEDEAQLSAEDLQQGHRLACQAAPLTAVRIHVPPESLSATQRLQVEGQSVEINHAPAVIAADVDIQPPNLYDLRSDVTRLQDALSAAGYAKTRFSLPVLSDLSERLRAQNWHARLALRGDEAAAVLPPLGADGRPPVLCGFAVDVGTTKLAAYLVDIESGETLAKTGAMNPQIAYGEDVISRIAYANHHPEGRQVLQARLVETLDLMISELCQTAGIQLEQVVDAVVVGNTAMHHIFAGLPVSQLGSAPYVPALGDAISFPAQAVGLRLATGASVYMPPNIAGYVGADHVAMLLGTGVAQISQEQLPHTILALDIGTNTEISLYHHGRHLSCSCASGPAFEGAHIRDGMRAAPGAIERVQIRGNETQISTIDHQPPVGICGSGILDAVAELLGAGLLDERGILHGEHPQMRRNASGKAEFILARANATAHGRDIFITRQDINEIQLAKAAIRTGIEILLLDAGITANEVEDFIVAGAFGTYIDLSSAVRIGMFPPLPVERFHQVGNAAGSGARQMLVSTQQRQLASQVAQRVEYVELTTHSSFTDIYIEALGFRQ